MEVLKRFFILILLTSCTGNLLQTLSSKSGDEDFIIEAQKALNAEDYDGAISIITTKVSGAGQITIPARETLASAYAGKCGLNFLDYTTALAAQSTGSPFRILMTPFVGITVSPSHCRTALSTMELIGTTQTRTANQNAFTSIVGMVLIGSALRAYADVAPADGDGIADISLCSGVTNTQMDDIIIGFGFMSKNFYAVSSSLVGSGASDGITDMIATCTLIAGSSCEVTDPTLITTQMRDTVRDFANTTEYGIGLYSTGGNDLLLPAACP